MTNASTLHISTRANGFGLSVHRILMVMTLTVGPFTFSLHLEEAAPQTIDTVKELLPLNTKMIHVRWSGEAGWMPMGAEHQLELGPENATSYPNPGELVLYPGGVSETEFLLGYGYVNFASKAGQLAGNHFATVATGQENLRELGRLLLWEGAQEVLLCNGPD